MTKKTRPDTLAAMAKDQVLAFRAEAELRARVRKHAERLAARVPGLHVAEADALRDLVVRGLDQVEGRAKKTKT